jgi:hypothetical protein
MTLKWYWFPLRRRLPVTFHMGDYELTVTWTGIFGVAVRCLGREWFFGAVRSHDAAGKATYRNGPSGIERSHP